MRWLMARLREPSTWRGITMLLTACGIALSQEQQEAIGIAGAAIIGLIGVFTSDAPKTVNVNLPPIELQSKSETRFQRYDDPDDHHSDSAIHRMRDAVPAATPSKADMDKHETGFNS